MGGSRATSDLAQGLGTTFAAAERMKTLHGAVGLSEVGALEMVEAPRLGPDGRLEAYQCSRADIAQVLRPRIEEILELMDGRLSKASAAGRPLPRRIVLTGGSSQLPSLQELAEDVFRGAHMCFITAGMGGGTGTGAAPIIAQAARELGILTVGVVTKPFHFEGKRRMRRPKRASRNCSKVVDTLIIIPNQNLFRSPTKRPPSPTPSPWPTRCSIRASSGVTDLMVMPGLINLDFADVRAVMARWARR
jgi:cell division ATPase FtsA